MKKFVNIEQTFCDSCGIQEYATKCLYCEVEHCWDCRKKLGIMYGQRIGLEGSGDGYYCLTCDALLRSSFKNPLHRAYLAIQKLSLEERSFYEDFTKRRKQTEKHLEDIKP